MRLRIAVLAATLLIAAGCSGGSPTTQPSSSSSAGSSTGLVDIGHGLRGPSGLQASVYATNLVHAAAFAFDAQGRLWVATADYTDVGADAVWMVPSAGATPVSVITGLHTPLGLLWLDGALYISSKERVDVYTDFDGAHFSSSHTVVTFPVGVGEVNGMTVTPDGSIVLGISSPCDHCEPTLQYSAAIVSFRQDGSDLTVFARGIRAPIALAYYPGTSDLFATMNQRDDLGDATPGDWLSVVNTGDDWGFPDCYGQGGDVCTGVPKPVAVLDKHAAVSGLVLATGQLGPTVGNAAIVAEWATGKLLSVPIAKTDNGYTGTAAPFITGMQNPVALTLAPDGALIAGDWTTGTIYRVTT
jgi:glucose/arabinose dehydrogenase